MTLTAPMHFEIAADGANLSAVRDWARQIFAAHLRQAPEAEGHAFVLALHEAARNIIEHAYDGRGLTENYLGTEDSEKGTGSLRNLAGEYHHSLRTLLARVAPEAARFLGRGDLWFRAFAMMTHTYSKQQKTDPLLNRDGVLQYKWGTEVGYQPLSWMAVSLRYDWVIRDIQDNENSFRIITPRVMFTTNWLLGAQVFLQYSRYAYGERVQLRPGQVALETAPDENVFKIQAQMVF